MAELLKVHLVFPENTKEIKEALAQFCLVTGHSLSLEEAASWAAEGGGTDPDLLLINCGPCLTDRKNSRQKKLLKHLEEIKKARPAGRIALLLPEWADRELEFVGSLMQKKIYDLWFADSFDHLDLRQFIYCERSLDDLLEYLSLREQKSQGEIQRGAVPGKIPGILYRPYYVHSNVVVFYAQDNFVAGHGLAVLTAFNLAEKGARVALVEPPSSVPLLAGSLSLGHPYKNTRHALAMYCRQDNDFIRRCLFNQQQYLEDANSPAEETTQKRDLSRNVFFLPDGLSTGNVSLETMQDHWSGFAAELIRILLFEQGFHFIIFTCCGPSPFNDVIKDRLAYKKYLMINLHPSSIVYGYREKNSGHGDVQIIGTRRIAYINEEIRDLYEETILYPPAGLVEEFLDYIYTHRRRPFSQETRAFIDRIAEDLGFKLQQAGKKGPCQAGLARLAKHLKGSGGGWL